MTEITIDLSDRVIQRLDKLVETQKAIARAIAASVIVGNDNDPYERAAASEIAEEALKCIGGFNEEDENA